MVENSSPTEKKKEKRKEKRRRFNELKRKISRKTRTTEYPHFGDRNFNLWVLCQQNCTTKLTIKRGAGFNSVTGVINNREREATEETLHKPTTGNNFLKRKKCTSNPCKNYSSGKKIIRGIHP